MQEPKYEFIDGAVRNRASGELIPEDEPVFIFRARDRHAAQAISYYSELVNDPTHHNVVRRRVADFQRFAAAHPERMKEPDSEPSNDT